MIGVIGQNGVKCEKMLASHTITRNQGHRSKHVTGVIGQNRVKGQNMLPRHVGEGPESLSAKWVQSLLYISTLNIGHSVDVIYIYIDFAKAFGKVVHTKLLFKLLSYGIDGRVLKWVEHFLMNRLQCVRVNGYYCNFISVLSPIPQGSVLGPISFRDYTVKLFADDVKLYMYISCNNASLILQEAITSSHYWAIDWQLEISYNKCQVLYLEAQHQHADHHLEMVF